MAYEIDFLPVGSEEKNGDAIALRFGDLTCGDRTKQVVVVVDGGFLNSGEALVKHINQYYKTDYIDIVVSTHPDMDHVSGLRIVLEKMQVGELWMHQPWDHTSEIRSFFENRRITPGTLRKALEESLNTAADLRDIAEKKMITIKEPFAGLTDSSGALRVLGPTETFYEQLLPQFRNTPDSSRFLERIRKLATSLGEAVASAVENLSIETLTDGGVTSAENESSVILALDEGNNRVLLTADAGQRGLAAAADYLEFIGKPAKGWGTVQVPHHGSHKNVGPTILNRLIGPKLNADRREYDALISVSTTDSRKHPAKQVLNAFRRRGSYVFATSGKSIYKHAGAVPKRDWGSAESLPFYTQVDVYDDDE